MLLPGKLEQQQDSQLYVARDNVQRRASHSEDLFVCDCAEITMTLSVSSHHQLQFEECEAGDPLHYQQQLQCDKHGSAVSCVLAFWLLLTTDDPINDGTEGENYGAAAAPPTSKAVGSEASGTLGGISNDSEHPQRATMALLTAMDADYGAPVGACLIQRAPLLTQLQQAAASADATNSVDAIVTVTPQDTAATTAAANAVGPSPSRDTHSVGGKLSVKMRVNAGSRRESDDAEGEVSDQQPPPPPQQQQQPPRASSAQQVLQRAAGVLKRSFRWPADKLHRVARRASQGSGGGALQQQTAATPYLSPAE